MEIFPGSLIGLKIRNGEGGRGEGWRSVGEVYSSAAPTGGSQRQGLQQPGRVSTMQEMP